MSNMHLSRLRIYPVKSLDPLEVTEAEIGIHSLTNDRLFAMVDEHGRYVNGKRTGRVNELRTEYDLGEGIISFPGEEGNDAASFELRQGNVELDNYLSDFFSIKLNLLRNQEGEFMDIPVNSSLTVVSEASLRALHQDLPRHSLESLRLRFRTNAELAGSEPYWEEQLFGAPGTGVRFRIGEVEMIGISPRARCNVPPRNPLTGTPDKDFVRDMIRSRADNLPDGSSLMEYGRSPYFLTVNVYLPRSEAGKTLRVGDEIKMLGPVDLTGTATLSAKNGG